MKYWRFLLLTTGLLFVADLGGQVVSDLEHEGCQLKAQIPFKPSSFHPYFPILLEFNNTHASPRRVTLRIEVEKSGWRQGSGPLFVFSRDLVLAPGANPLQWATIPLPSSATSFGQGNLLIKFRLQVEEKAGAGLATEWLDWAAGGPQNQRMASSGGQIQSPIPSILVSGQARDRLPEVSLALERYLQKKIGAANFNTTSGKPQTHSITPLEIPLESAALARVDHLVLAGVSPDDLNPRQRDAVRRAVREGLTAWIIPDASGKGNRWVLDESQASSAARVIGDEGLEQVFFLPETDRGVPFAEAGEGTPEVMLYRDGLGDWRRFTSVVPVEIPNALRTVNRHHMWARAIPASLIQRSAAVTGRYNYSRPSPSPVLSIDRGLRRMIGPRTVLSFAAIYLLVIGPGLYLVLKRIRRMAWQLWLQPVIVVCFLLVTWIIGATNYGLVSRDHDTLLVFQQAGEREALLVNIHSHYSPIGTGYTLPGEGSAVLPLEMGSSSARVNADSSGALKRKTRTWSLTHSMTYSVVDLGGSTEVQRNTQGWSCSNNLPYPILNAVSKTGNKSSSGGNIGDILSGSTVEWAVRAQPGSRRTPESLKPGSAEKIRSTLATSTPVMLAPTQLVGLVPVTDLQRVVGREKTADWAVDDERPAFHIVLGELDR